ncbi:MAG TPA: GNAT family N-acetyltransferase [Gemmatimonadaceae bacterium]|nr:GNAT family N-acetyltransferase [Gemmatimonadaceae bacterium]
MTQDIVLRGACARDVDGIARLIAGFAAQGLMLPRTAESIALALDDFVVAIDERGRVLACGALKEYSPSLAEVASLAVASSAHGHGVGRAVVARLEALARVRGIHELFALTLTPAFFEAVGYAVVERERYPEKMRRDCAHCTRRFTCGEVCVGRTVRAHALGVAA